MRRFRFHIGTLIILVLVLGVGFAALRESNEIWDGGIFSMTLVILLTSVLLASLLVLSDAAKVMPLVIVAVVVAYVGVAHIGPRLAARMPGDKHAGSGAPADTPARA